MKLEEVLQAARDGKKVQRISWRNTFFYIGTNKGVSDYSTQDLLSDDWEIVDEHKPCPFCGSSKAEFVGGYDSIECSDCGSMGPPKNSIADAWAAWDRRTP